VAALLGATSAQALTLEPVSPQTFAQPTYVTSAPGEPNRLFVVEREGTVQLVQNGNVTEFTDLSSAVDCPCAGERGLMSIAFDPDFDQNDRLYVFYGSESDREIHVARLTADPGHQTASPATLEQLLEIPHPTSDIHYGGQLQFGPDGALYVSTGDGGGNNDPDHNAQNPASRLGKILRIDPISETTSLWSRGLRNPFRFSFDALSGDMIIGDVGQAAREEIDFAPSPSPGTVGGGGANYGWNCREGLIAGPATDPECNFLSTAAFTPPVFDYPHTPDPDLGGAKRCAILGGYVARDAALGALYGRYLYADLCSGAIRSLQLPATASGSAGGDCSLGLRVTRPVSFGEDAARRLYVVEEGGEVSRIVGLPPAGCPATLGPPALEPPSPKPTFVGIKAQRRRVERGKSALLTVWVSPCSGRKGDLVRLLRNGHRNGSRFLSRACTARFLRRVHRNTTFAAATTVERSYLAGKSRKLKIRIVARRHR
jgi:hypothetical protein